MRLFPGDVGRLILEFLAKRGDQGAVVADVATLYDEWASPKGGDISGSDRVNWSKVHLSRLRSHGYATSKSESRPSDAPTTRGPYRVWRATKKGLRELEALEEAL